MPGINGLPLSRIGPRILSIGAGNCRDTTDTTTIKISAGQTRQVNLDQAGLGGLDAGAVAANQSYAVFVVRQTNGTVSGLASLSPVAPAVPAGAKFRRVGSVATDGNANVIAFTQSGAGVTRTHTYVSPAPVVLLNGAATVWTEFSIRPVAPAWASQAVVDLTLVGSGTTVANGDGSDPTHFNPPAGSKVMVPDVADHGEYQNDGGGGSTTIVMSAFTESV